jgi:hypothetical protein
METGIPSDPRHCACLLPVHNCKPQRSHTRPLLLKKHPTESIVTAHAVAAQPCFYHTAAGAATAVMNASSSIPYHTWSSYCIQGGLVLVYVTCLHVPRAFNAYGRLKDDTATGASQESSGATWLDCVYSGTGSRSWPRTW